MKQRPHWQESGPPLDDYLTAQLQPLVKPLVERGVRLLPLPLPPQEREHEAPETILQLMGKIALPLVWQDLE